MERPLVSVIVPVYNGERFLAQALDSVFAQDYRPLEVIVVDDGSTDRTAQIAQAYDVRYIHQPNQGHGMAKNVGVRAARGEYLAFIDADDLWEPRKLSLQVALLQRQPELGYVICNMRHFLESRQSVPRWLEGIDLDEAVPAYIPSAMLIRTHALDRVGNFDPSYRRANDVDWHFRARDAGVRMANVDRLLVYKRVHSDNLTHDRAVGTLAATEMFRAIRSSIDRKRQGQSRQDLPGEDDGH